MWIRNTAKMQTVSDCRPDVEQQGREEQQTVGCVRGGYRLPGHRGQPLRARVHPRGRGGQQGE
jgi:hypothetical protein